MLKKYYGVISFNYLHILKIFLYYLSEIDKNKQQQQKRYRNASANKNTMRRHVSVIPGEKKVSPTAGI